MAHPMSPDEQPIGLPFYFPFEYRSPNWRTIFHLIFTSHVASGALFLVACAHSRLRKLTNFRQAFSLNVRKSFSLCKLAFFAPSAPDGLLLQLVPIFNFNRLLPSAPDGHRLCLICNRLTHSPQVPRQQLPLSSSLARLVAITTAPFPERSLTYLKVGTLNPHPTR